VARGAAGLLRDSPDRIWQGTALETLVFQEIRIYNQVSGQHRPVAYYRTPAGVEIDFIIETAARQASKVPEVIAIAVKRSEQWQREWCKPILNLAGTKNVNVKHMIGVYCGERTYQFGNIQVFPFKDFVHRLTTGEFY
jgi:predicted AAA+ superfamily ATPase